MSQTINFSQYFGKFIRAKKDVRVMAGPSYKKNYPGRTVKAGDIIFQVWNFSSISTWEDDYDGDGVLPRNWLISTKYEYVLYDESAFEIDNASTTEVKVVNAIGVVVGQAIDYVPYNANFKIISPIPWLELGGTGFSSEMPVPGDTISGKRMRIYNKYGQIEEILLWHAVLYGVDTHLFIQIPLKYLEKTNNFPSQGREASEDNYESVGSLLSIAAKSEDTVKLIGTTKETVAAGGDIIIDGVTTVKDPLKTSDIKNTATAVQTGVSDVVAQKPLVVSNFTEDKTDIPFIIKLIGIGLIIWLILK